MTMRTLCVTILAAASLAAMAETCITADEYNHVQNGGSPLPGTISQSVSGLSVSIDAETFSETLYGPFGWPVGFFLIFR